MTIVVMSIIDMYSKRMHGEPTLGFLLWRVVMKWRAAVDRAVAPWGLTHAQYSLLASLYGLTGAGARPSQRELADYTGLDPVYVSRLVRALERAGLVSRTESTLDSRAFQLLITEYGVDVVRQAIVRVRDLQEELTASIGGTRSQPGRDLAATLQVLLASSEEAQPVPSTTTSKLPPRSKRKDQEQGDTT
jgi:DNA-binding MarR family transcriptional regulator